MALPFGLGGSSELLEALNDIDWKVIMLTMDSLGANKCIIREEQDRIAAEQTAKEEQEGKDAERKTQEGQCFETFLKINLMVDTN